MLAELRVFCALITGAAGSDWSETAFGTYNSNSIYVELSHTAGAQMLFVSATGVDTGNMYAGAAVSTYRLLVAFKPSSLSASPFPTIDDTTNPSDTPTYLSGVGSYLFHYLNAVDSPYFRWYQDDVIIRMVIDTESAYMWFTATENNNTTIECMLIHADDDGSAPNLMSVNPGDVNSRAFTLFRNGLLLQTGTFDGQFIDSGGTRREDPVMTVRDGNLSWTTDLWRTGASVLRFELSHPTGGRKGIVDERVYCRMRDDLYGRQLFKVAGESYRMLHWDGGRVFPWPTDEPVIW
jgi:hypothetical protein